jgi:hypothetical protein
VNKGTSRTVRIKAQNLWQLAVPTVMLEFDSVIVGAIQPARSHAHAIVPLQ